MNITFAVFGLIFSQILIFGLKTQKSDLQEKTRVFRLISHIPKLALHTTFRQTICISTIGSNKKGMPQHHKP